MQVSGTELTLDQTNDIRVVPLRSGARSSFDKRTADSGRKNRLLRLAPLREGWKKATPPETFYGVDGATAAKPMSCTKKKEKRRWLRP
jgi:hypothetical protein